VALIHSGICGPAPKAPFCNISPVGSVDGAAPHENFWIGELFLPGFIRETESNVDSLHRKSLATLPRSGAGTPALFRASERVDASRAKIWGQTRYLTDRCQRADHVRRIRVPVKVSFGQ